MNTGFDHMLYTNVSDLVVCHFSTAALITRLSDDLCLQNALENEMK